jgi:hypothetical protein
MCNNSARLMRFTKSISSFLVWLCASWVSCGSGQADAPGASLLRRCPRPRAARVARSDRISARAAARAKSRRCWTGTFFHGNFARRLTNYRARGSYFGENLAGVGSRGRPQCRPDVAGEPVASRQPPAGASSGSGWGLRRNVPRYGTSVVTANFAGRQSSLLLHQASRSASFSRRSRSRSPRSIPAPGRARAVRARGLNGFVM